MMTTDHTLSNSKYEAFYVIKTTQRLGCHSSARNKKQPMSRYLRIIYILVLCNLYIQGQDDCYKVIYETAKANYYPLHTYCSFAILCVYKCQMWVIPYQID